MIAGSGFGGVLIIGFVLAFLVVWMAWAQRSQSVKASDPLPDATFDFQKSWLSTFTALLAILGSLNLSGLAFASDPSYSVLNLFFALLVAVAPLVYVALGATGKGTVGGFLAACVATLWAAFGVVISLGVILSQVTQASQGPELATILIMAVLVLTIPLIAAYGYGKLSSLLKPTRAAATREVTFL